MQPLLARLMLLAILVPFVADGARELVCCGVMVLRTTCPWQAKKNPHLAARCTPRSRADRAQDHRVSAPALPPLVALPTWPVALADASLPGRFVRDASFRGRSPPPGWVLLQVIRI